MSGDLTRIDAWIYATLTGDAQLSGLVSNRVYRSLAPQGALGPMVIFSFLGGADKFVTLSNRSTNAIYLIRAVRQSSSIETIEPIADRVDALLTIPNQGVLVRDTLITSVVREQPHERTDLENGVPYVYLGGFYRFRYQPQA